jgi:hypothetical protein
MALADVPGRVLDYLGLRPSLGTAGLEPVSWEVAAALATAAALFFAYWVLSR